MGRVGGSASFYVPMVSGQSKDQGLNPLDSLGVTLETPRVVAHPCEADLGG